jgi:hypothetical protein
VLEPVLPEAEVPPVDGAVEVEVLPAEAEPGEERQLARQPARRLHRRNCPTT